MNKILKHKLFFGALFFIVLTYTSCDEVEDINIEGTSVESMSGDWWIVALQSDGTTPAYNGDYVRFTTYNTAANDGTMWIDDNGNFFEIKTKVNTDVNKLSFSGNKDADEVLTNSKITISNGKIVKNAYTTKSNTEVDEISFEVEISWDPGKVYKFKGHKRTGFTEDENPHFSN